MDSGNRKKNWFPNKYCRICSEHFQEKDFNLERKRRVLFDNAYPTVNVYVTTNIVINNKVKVTPSTYSTFLSSNSVKRSKEPSENDIMETTRKKKSQKK
ncbi:unnamed protein product [Euphydryas editha]|uniref:THAP-type domain-containing protein n=1 Tax=Euphydryas editha TaxID=104508 RepID=A0AAU9UE82_EUPED|nr:unnamed protein product [Euphydryas editha]